MFKEYTAYSIEEACGIISKRLYKKDFAWIDIKSGDYKSCILPVVDKERWDEIGFSIKWFQLWATLDGNFVHEPTNFPLDYGVLESAERFMKDLPIYLEIQYFD